ncbi:alpha/beta fold hydrolase [Octadecabacter ascidiaceicola]|uniref:Acyl-CoA esterase n=1 Tax=Octadecabacter ascidiaceicola TaxID=1655543 RepID=A0A238K3C6_9RHOB|nr:alpha/beta hydrolase [Octadecabacter ascidiaceicola]SMX36894.1 acyl-CoA esterase [Octadecabacter ascidiaceicola]
MLQSLAGQEVFTLAEGEGSSRLFVHCSLARHESLIPLARALPPARNIYFDMPGHGRSAEWNGSDYQTDVVDIAAQLLDGPAHLIGHSFGATVALRLAAERPDLVSRLTLIEPVMFAAATDPEAIETHRAAFAAFVKAWTEGDRETAAKLFVAMWGTGPAWDDLPAKMRAMLAAQIHLIPAASAAIEDDVHGVLGKLDRVTCPVDLIEGSNSQPIMSAILDGLAGALPQAQRSVIEGAGHMVPITHIAQVASVLQGR